MNWFKENWLKVGILVVLVVSIIGAFYWYEWRSSQIKKDCQFLASQGRQDENRFSVSKLLTGGEDQETINELYLNCIRSRGL